jgi:hypothetical protein
VFFRVVTAAPGEGNDRHPTAEDDQSYDPHWHALTIRICQVFSSRACQVFSNQIAVCRLWLQCRFQATQSPGTVLEPADARPVHADQAGGTTLV